MSDITLPMAYQRWAILVEYNGQDYVGWQRQKTGLSVQQLIEEAATILTSGRAVSSVTSGRTDSGVHAAGMVAHLDFPADVKLTPHTVREALNFSLKPHPVVILKAAPVPPDWSARFSALWRHYRYTILNRPARSALTEGFVWHIKHPLDERAMQEGANHLIGRHDFTSFRAKACQAHNPVRTLETLSVSRQGELVFIETKAQAFLHHQVRNIVGTLSLVGCGQWQPERVKTALNAHDRCKAGPTAPAHGLCFIGVGYETDIFSNS